MDSLIKIGGAPITKLIEVISNGIGKLYEPAHLILMARAEAKAEHIKYFAEAKRDAWQVKIWKNCLALLSLVVQMQVKVAF